ncbi:MAG TPA: Lrp/AsnC family transcriptional regulator [Usitatibacter sp.]|jgi:DNA-binding Lrp family transcriptional regulator|nr:Lrp/AsnC family transcriptional regulator [Usitatibacter sp.]
MTPKDQQLIGLLRANARESVAALARKLGVARSTVVARLKRLEESGAIAGYTVRLGQTAQRPAITAHVLLEASAKRADTLVRELKALPAIRGVYAISGAFDYLAILETPTTHDMDAILDRIGRIEGVARTQTHIALSVKFERP